MLAIRSAEASRAARSSSSRQERTRSPWISAASSGTASAIDSQIEARCSSTSVPFVDEREGDHTVILVTGATGSVGSNVCRLATDHGVAVRALVRGGSDIEPLKRCGVEAVVGDVTDPPSLAAATRGVQHVIHCAAQIGGSWSTAEASDFEAVNQWGTINVLDAAQTAGISRTVVLLSAVIGERGVTATETSPIAALGESHSPYTRTKLAAYYEGMARAARGMDVNFVVPGGV